MELQTRLVPFRPQLQRHILAMVRDPAEAEELTQDAYARALERAGQLRDPQAALAWLYRIATTVALDRLRRRRPNALPLDTVAPPGDDAERDRSPSLLEGALERSEMSACVQSYLAALPDDYRIAILLHDAEGLGGPEIAGLLGWSLPTVKIRIHRARARLREALAAACDFQVDERGVLVCDPRPEAAGQPLRVRSLDSDRLASPFVPSAFLDTIAVMADPLELLSCCTPLVRPKLGEAAAVELERLFQALADRNRLRVVNMLAQADGEAICVCEFQDALDLKQPTVSYHLKQLTDAGVIAREQRGRFAFYSLRPGVLDRIAELVRPQAVPA